MGDTHGDSADAAFLRLLQPDVPPHLSWWQHRKGGVYTVVCHCVVEATLTPAVVYAALTGEGAGRVWCRPLEEFLDGRFTRVQKPGEENHG